MYLSEDDLSFGKYRKDFCEQILSKSIVGKNIKSHNSMLECVQNSSIEKPK